MESTSRPLVFTPPGRRWWRQVPGWTALIVAVLVVRSSKSGVSATDVVIGIGMVLWFVAMMRGVHALIGRARLAFDGWTVTVRPAIGASAPLTRGRWAGSGRGGTRWG